MVMAVTATAAMGMAARLTPTAIILTAIGPGIIPTALPTGLSYTSQTGIAGIGITATASTEAGGAGKII